MEKRNSVVELVLSGKQDEDVSLAVYLIQSGIIKSKVAAIKNGKVALEIAANNNDKLAVGPDTEDIKALSVKDLFPIQDYKKTRLVIPQDRWDLWRGREITLSGDVSRCLPIIVPVSGRIAAPQIPVRCYPICNGVVEVYKTECCCPVIPPPRDFCDLFPFACENICERFPKLCDEWPELSTPWDPGIHILENYDYLQSVLANDPNVEMALPPQRVIEDAISLRKLPKSDINDFIQSRPYLRPILFPCRCSTSKIGESVIDEYGHFSFTYHSLIVPRPGCTVTYFFKVKQFLNNQWVYVYDGTQEHFSQDDVIHLRTFNRQALTCYHYDPPLNYPEPFVILQSIGHTDTYRLSGTPQAAEDGLNTVLADNAGLANGESPWAKTLSLLLYIHPDLKNIATFYRLSVVEADPSGNPKPGAPRKYLSSPVSWSHFYYDSNTHETKIGSKSLGPFIRNGEEALYQIPYPDNSEPWLGNQFHMTWDTTAEKNGRHLMKLDLFDGNGNKIKPLGAPGGGTEAEFVFLYRTNSTDTQEVPFPNLLHLFWVDNEPCKGLIEDILGGSGQIGGDCRFLSGDVSDSVTAYFRAYHNNGPVNGTFMRRYSLTYTRGLNQTVHDMAPQGYSNAPVTRAQGLPATAQKTFGELLDTGPNTMLKRCTFALRLYVESKHTNGFGQILEYNIERIASFALEVK